MALEGVKDGYVEALVSPEHWLKGYLAVKLMAQAAQSGKALPEGLWNPGALIVSKKNIDQILARQQSPESRTSFFKPIVDQQVIIESICDRNSDTGRFTRTFTRPGYRCSRKVNSFSFSKGLGRNRTLPGNSSRYFLT